MFTQWIAKKRLVLLAAGLWMALPAMVFAEAKQVELPMEISDAFGTRWDIQPNGTIGDGGADQFDIASDLSINGDFNYNIESQVGSFDEKTREYLFPEQSSRDLSISRRVFIDADKGFCRWIETFKNNADKPQNATIMLRTGIGQGISSTRSMLDERNPARKYGCIVGNSVFGFAFIGTGRGVKTPCQISTREMEVLIQYRVEIPAKKSVSIVHAIITRKSSDSIKKISDSDILAGISPEILRNVINFRSRDTLSPDLDLLKPVGNDAIEMEGGDSYVGAISQDSITLETAHGKINVPMDQLAGIIRAKDARKNFLAAMKDDQVLVGKLSGNFKFTLSDQRAVEFPAERISRVGVKQGLDDSLKNSPFTPMILLRSGACYTVKEIEGALDLQTRFGKYSIPFSKVNAIQIVDELNVAPFHEVRLADGSILRGIILNSSLKIKGEGVLKDKSLEFLLSSVSSLALDKPLGELDPSVSAIETVSNDLIAGTLKGTLELRNDLGVIKVNASQARRFEPVKGAEADVAVVLWDQSRIVGEIVDQNLVCQSVGGLEFKIPASMILAFDQPIPAYPEELTADIRRRLSELLALNEAQRGRQWDKLQPYGPGLIPLIVEMEKDLPEDQQKILGDYVDRLKPLAVRTPAKQPETEEVFIDPKSMNPDMPGWGGEFDNHMWFEDDIMNKDGNIDFEGDVDVMEEEFFNKP